MMAFVPIERNIHHYRQRGSATQKVNSASSEHGVTEVCVVDILS